MAHQYMPETFHDPHRNPPAPLLHTSSYFYKRWVQYYCLNKNQVSKTFCSKFIRSQIPYQLQNLKILLKIWGHKKPSGQNFWNLIFFLSGKARLQILSTKKLSWANIIFIHNSYNEFIDKIVKQLEKQGKNETLQLLAGRISLLLQTGSSSFQVSQSSTE